MQLCHKGIADITGNNSCKVSTDEKDEEALKLFQQVSISEQGLTPLAQNRNLIS